MDEHFITIRGLPIIFLVFSMLFSCANSDAAKDREECTEQLVGLSTCLPYVGGTAKAPTPDCCSGLKQVLKTNKKCLCVIIRDRNDPELGLTINVTLALGLPTICNAPANVSLCPGMSSTLKSYHNRCVYRTFFGKIFENGVYGTIE